ncbi:5'-nucleotidase C-terminal domain-containing protein [uncultured Mediterranea sp.]|uniref:bifunctional metallophosphatase/5'-nucleotidase n=1 Tax=uncultured Mediterranea sp. TaxID=1926662 RepID=UPI0027D9C212|nr:5'-nucleotidase C-terminal domain-containing protein [uncultured Mediterranea sp.]
MRKKNILFLMCLLLAFPMWAQEQQEVKLKLVQTSDVHGNYYPYDFIVDRDAAGSLSHVCSYVRQERRTYGDRLVLLDNGDILQGQPTAYYYNYMDTTSVHLCADMMNFMGYDAGNMGNHDVETGRTVFDRWASDCRFPILGANIVDVATGQPHFKPYVVLQRGGVKVAVLGMITPAIPAWLSENLWRGLCFDDMEETARRWMQVIREREKPDVVVGIFHSGRNAYVMNGKYNENASADVARRVPGFDVVMMGHDHALACEKVVNVEGDSVLIINPANNASIVSAVDVTLTLRDGRVTGKHVSGELVRMDGYEPDAEFTAHFAPQRKAVEQFVSKRIGRFTESISTRPAYFGPSAFVDFIHQLQLAISGADISLAAPLSFDAEIRAGDIFVSDMFNLYKYENMLYVMSLSGKEIRGALEMSYALWTNCMTSADDPLLLLRDRPREGAADRAAFQNPSYNFDSAAGIIYTVDVTKPEGQKVHIVSMADGTPFDEAKMYKVAVNSYRGNGGGELLTRGAGIPQDELEKRILSSTDKDLRYYLMQYIEQQQTLTPRSLNQWRFIPEDWAGPASRRDYRRLFGDGN